MARRYQFVNSFAAGELAPEYVMRSDLQARGEGARLFRNVIAMAGGGWRRRPGTDHVTTLNGLTRLETLGTGIDDSRLLLFGPGRFQVRMPSTGALLQSIDTNIPWTAADLWSMQVAIEDDRIVVSSRAFRPRVLTLTAGVWSIQNFVFTPGLNGALSQPYFRFADRGVSLTPSATSGSVTLQTSAAYFAAGHVGTRIRYTGVEIQITAVSNATTATGNVIGSLYPTLSVTVASSSGFIVGQEVSGEDSQVRGVVSSVPDGTTVVVQLIDGYTHFDGAEDLIGPTAKSAISGQSPTSPAATTDWDEALISPVRGWPGAVAIHRNRLIFGDFPQAQSVMAASATGDIGDFSAGTGLDTDAIIERVGRSTSLGLKHFGSTEQLLIFTEAGPFYVPEQVAAPLSPTNFEILQIGPEAVASPAPLLVSEGMMFVEQFSGRVMISIPTGNVRRSWEIADLSELAFHLMGSPVEIRLQAARTESDRQVILVRDDGQAAVLSYRRGQAYSAWGLWNTDGKFRSMCVAGGRLYTCVERDFDGEIKFNLEVFDDECWGDDVRDMAGPAALLPAYASCEVGVWDGDSKIGTFEMDDTGRLMGIDQEYGALRIARDFLVEVEVVPPIDPEVGQRPKYRIVRADVDVIRSTAFQGNGYDPSGWSAGIGGGTGPTTEVRRFRTMGRGKEHSFKIVQSSGGPLQCRSITLEVSY